MTARLGKTVGRDLGDNALPGSTSALRCRCGAGIILPALLWQAPTLEKKIGLVQYLG